MHQRGTQTIMNTFINGLKIYNMEKKKRDISLPKRFNSEDVKKWQEQANLTTGGNLTLWMENALNNAVKKQNVKSKQ